jgi:hypothetical protein
LEFGLSKCQSVKDGAAMGDQCGSGLRQHDAAWLANHKLDTRCRFKARQVM